MNKIILADNQGVFRTGVAKILAMEDDMRIIAQCSDSERLQRALETFRGVTVLLFASTMNVNPSDLMVQIEAQNSKAIAILESGESTQPYIDAHVHGLFFRSITGPTLVDCVRRVGRGERAIHSVANATAMPDEDLVGARVRDRLTPKEMKIVALIVQGCKNKEIGFRLGTTEQVIKNHLRGIYDKIGVSDRLELAMFAIHHPLLLAAVKAAEITIVLPSCNKNSEDAKHAYRCRLGHTLGCS